MVNFLNHNISTLKPLSQSKWSHLMIFLEVLMNMKKPTETQKMHRDLDHHNSKKKNQRIKDLLAKTINNLCW